MTTMIRNAAAAAGLVAALALPLGASAATTTAGPQHYTLQTRYFDDHSAGEYDGALTLTTYANGIVQGTYRSADTGDFKDVTGGLTEGGRIWLDIGNGADAVHLTGTFRDGKLVTTASIPGPDRYTFESITPRP